MLVKTLLFAVGLVALPLLAQQSTPDPLTNERIIQLVKGGIQQDELARLIATAPSISFNLTPSGMSEMMKAGVSENTIKAMAAREHGGSAVPEQQQSPIYQPQQQPSSPAYNSPFPQPKQRSAGAVGDYIAKGYKEVNIFGTVIIPHASASDATGAASGRFGYYIARNSLVGVDFTVLATNGYQFYMPGGFYRYVQHTANPRFLPFFGGEAGAAVQHLNAGFFGSATSSVFAAKAEAGIKYFLAQHISFELAYNLIYLRVSGGDFKDSTESLVGFGFAYTF